LSEDFPNCELSIKTFTESVTDLINVCELTDRYIACQLENEKKTQSQICKASEINDGTLRKVYKEVFLFIDEILPPEYQPMKPLLRRPPYFGLFFFQTVRENNKRRKLY
jgi:hypothetical protein